LDGIAVKIRERENEECKRETTEENNKNRVTEREKL
jgi:hypothetical protein